jgi:hypothetical protein
VSFWGVVQLVGHLTVNEDGVGSSPTAPANLHELRVLSVAVLLYHRTTVLVGIIQILVR